MPSSPSAPGGKQGEEGQTAGITMGLQGMERPFQAHSPPIQPWKSAESHSQGNTLPQMQAFRVADSQRPAARPPSSGLGQQQPPDSPPRQMLHSWPLSTIEVSRTLRRASSPACRAACSDRGRPRAQCSQQHPMSQHGLSIPSSIPQHFGTSLGQLPCSVPCRYSESWSQHHWILAPLGYGTSTHTSLPAGMVGMLKVLKLPPPSAIPNTFLSAFAAPEAQSSRLFL